MSSLTDRQSALAAAIASQEALAQISQVPYRQRLAWSDVAFILEALACLLFEEKQCDLSHKLFSLSPYDVIRTFFHTASYRRIVIGYGSN